MSNVGWFLLGGAAAYFLFRGAGAGGGLSFSASVGADAGLGKSYRGAQYPSGYEPLGTVGGFPAQDGADGGFGGVFAFGGNGSMAANPQGYADQFPASSNGAFDPKGVSNDGNQYQGCLTGAKA
jgi:hypothetical protein